MSDSQEKKVSYGGYKFIVNDRAIVPVDDDSRLFLNAIVDNSSFNDEYSGFRSKLQGSSSDQGVVFESNEDLLHLRQRLASVAAFEQDLDRNRQQSNERARQEELKALEIINRQKQLLEQDDSKRKGCWPFRR